MRGSGFASGPGAARRGCSAPLLSLARAKNGLHAVFRLSEFLLRKNSNEMETADILSAASLPFLGLGFSLRENPRE
jgi:hypothetical protein